MNVRTNIQLVTRWANETKRNLSTRLEQQPIRPLKNGEILVEMLCVPLHGSFWLATHPHVLHPRIEELMVDDYFVFGSGGVGRVIETTETGTDVRIGDYVCIFGHVPCRRHDCYGCHVLHRYTECDYKESTIIGHGNHAHDGTYAKYVILPRHAWEICFQAEQQPTVEQLYPYMYAFLMADVRNALTRHPDTLRMRRMLLVGGGLSGHIAAYIHSHSCPESKILVVETTDGRGAAICSLNPGNMKFCTVPAKLVASLNQHTHKTKHVMLNDFIMTLQNELYRTFGTRGCNLIFDCSSGNSAPIWNNPFVLQPSMHCIVFGFGSDAVFLNRDIVQLSGLNIMTSRGVGNLRNRREVVELIRSGADGFLNNYLIKQSKPLNGLAELERYVAENHSIPTPLHECEQAYCIL